MKKGLKIFNVFLITVIIFSSLCFTTATENEIVTEDLDIVATPGNLSEDNNEVVENLLIMSTPEDLLEESNEVVDNLLTMAAPDSNEINSDLFLTQENISVEKIVKGSLYLIGDNIKISSPVVDGNVFAIGDEIDITGKINGCVYAISKNVKVSGEVEDLYIISNSLNISENAYCRDVKVTGNNVEIEGKIARNLYALTDNVNIANTERASIDGTLFITGNVTGATDKINEISKIDKGTEKIEELEEIGEGLGKAFEAFGFISAAIGAFFIIGIILICTKKSDTYATDAKEMFVSDTLRGLKNWLLCALIAILLFVTIIGIPVSILFIFVIWILFYKVNIPVATIEISKLIFKNSSKSKWKVFIIAFGVFLVLQIVSRIPILGILIKYIVSLYGFGFMYRKLFKKDNENVNNVIKEQN